jgi:hypothetical protein
VVRGEGDRYEEYRQSSKKEIARINVESPEQSSCLLKYPFRYR